MHRFSVLILVVLLSLLLLAGCGTFDTPMPALDGTEPVPSLSLPTPDGQWIALDGFPGQVVFINFWGTYCPPCVEELPELQEVYETLQDEGFVVLGLNAEEKPEKVQAFVQEKGITFPIVISDDATINPIFHLKHMPTTWFVDKHGILRGKIEGQMSKAMALKIARQLLAED